MIIFRDKAFKKVISVLIRKRKLNTQRLGMCIHRRKIRCRHGEKSAICKLRREVSEETKLINTLLLEFWPPGLWDNMFLLCKPNQTVALGCSSSGNSFKGPTTVGAPTCWAGSMLWDSPGNASASSTLMVLVSQPGPAALSQSCCSSCTPSPWASSQSPARISNKTFSMVLKEQTRQRMDSICFTCV